MQEHDSHNLTLAQADGCKIEMAKCGHILVNVGKMTFHLDQAAYQEFSGAVVYAAGNLQRANKQRL